MSLESATDQATPSLRWLWRLPLAIGVLQVLFGIVVLVWVAGISLVLIGVLVIMAGWQVRGVVDAVEDGLAA